MVPPASARLEAPAAAVTAPPAQVVAPAGVPVFAIAAGYVSVNAAPLIAVVFGLVSVIVSTEVPPGPIEAGANTLVAVGGESTASVAEAPGTVPAFVVVTLPVLLR